MGDRYYLQFERGDCYCVDQQVVLQRQGQVMRRLGDHASPEVFRSKPGTFTFAELAADMAFDALEASIAQRCIPHRTH